HIAARATLFPYTTLFRSIDGDDRARTLRCQSRLSPHRRRQCARRRPAKRAARCPRRLASSGISNDRVRGERDPLAVGEQHVVKPRYTAFADALDQWSKETS